MRKILITTLLFGLLLAVSASAVAQQSREFNDYVVHYNALRTDMLTPQITQAYDIQRSSSRALLNISVLKKSDSEDGPETAVAAAIAVHAANLTGQRRDIELREISSGDAIYYLGEFPVHNMETYRFKLEVLPEGESEPLLVDFQQQFYTE